MEFPFTLFGIAGFTTVVWLVGTFLTAPVKREHLLAFYRRVHPGGPGWRAVAAQVPEVKGDTGYWAMFWCWIVTSVMIYGVLFGIGKILLLDYAIGFACLGRVRADGLYFVPGAVESGLGESDRVKWFRNHGWQAF